MTKKKTEECPKCGEKSPRADGELTGYACPNCGHYFHPRAD